MAIYRKSVNGVWYFSVYLPGKNNARLRGSCGTRNRDEALIVEQTMRLGVSRETSRERLIRVINALFPEDEACHDDPPLPALAFDFTQFVEQSCGTFGENRRRQRNAIERFVKWVREKMPRVTTLRMVDRRVAQAYAAHLAASGKIKRKTIYNGIGQLSSAWNLLKRRHDSLDNPWPLAMPMEVEEDRGLAFTPQQVRRVFAAADAVGHGWELAVRIAAATGLRLGDTLRLRHSDVVNGALRVIPAKTKRFCIATVLPLPPDILAMIPASGDGPLMPELAKYKGHHFNFLFPFSTVLERAGLDGQGFTFHSFRHYFRTQLARAGVRDDVAMRLGGWTQRDTAARYDHDDHRDELANAIKGAWALTEGN